MSNGSDNLDLVISQMRSADKRDWTQYVARHPLASLAHSLAWQAVVEKSFGLASHYFVARTGPRIVGVLPMSYVRSAIFGRFLVSSPYLSHGGVLADEDRIAARLKEAAYARAVELKADFALVRNLRSEKAETLSLLPDSPYTTLVLTLSDDTSTLWRETLSGSARRNVRRAHKSGLKIHNDADYLASFTRINDINMRRLGTPAHGLDFFRNIIALVPGADLLTVHHEGQVVGGALMTRFGETAHLSWIASLPDVLQMRPNNLLYWAGIEWAMEHGCRKLDFGRSKPGAGTFRFKTQFGAEPQPLDYAYLLHRRRTEPQIDQDNPRFQMLISLWKRMPLPLTRLLGPKLIQGIP